VVLPLPDAADLCFSQHQQDNRRRQHLLFAAPYPIRTGGNQRRGSASSTGLPRTKVGSKMAMMLSRRPQDRHRSSEAFWHTGASSADEEPARVTEHPPYQSALTDRGDPFHLACPGFPDFALRLERFGSTQHHLDDGKSRPRRTAGAAPAVSGI